MNNIKREKPLHSSFRIKTLALTLFFSIFFMPQAVYTEIKNEKNIVEINYIAGQTSKNEYIQGALQFLLSPGWKTYWRNPGPFGIRPIIDWSGSENVQNIDFFWPTPKIFNQYEIPVIGYENLLTIPMEITKISSKENAVLKIHLEFGVCSNICVLKTAQINTPLHLQGPIENIDLISKALKTVPTNITEPVFSLSSCIIEKKSDDLIVIYSIQLSEFPKSKPSMIIEYTFSDKYLENQIMEIKGKKLRVTASLKNIYEADGIIERDRLNALLILENRGFEIAKCN